MSDPSLVVIGSILVVAALLLIVKEELNQRAHRRWCDGKARAEGKVTRIGARGHLSRNEPTSEDRFVNVAVVTYKAANGVAYELDAPGESHEIGKVVEVAYDPAVPSDARPVNSPRQLGCAAVLGLAGAALLIYGL